MVLIKLRYQRISYLSISVTNIITSLSFDKEQGLSEHTAPFNAVVEILEEESPILIAGNPKQVKAGEWIILPANIPHALQVISLINTKMRILSLLIVSEQKKKTQKDIRNL